MSHGDLSLFALQAGHALGVQVAQALGVNLAVHEERDFADGEHKSRPLDSVRGRDVFVIQALHAEAAQSVNDKLCRLLFFLGALREAGAARLTAVVPYLCYARADRQFDPRDPVTSLYVAQVLEAMGVDAVLTFDVHNLSAYQNAFRCRKEHLEARHLFVGHLAQRLQDEDVTVVSPDAGGMKRAERFQRALETALHRPVGMAYMEKHRRGEGLSGRILAGGVQHRTAIVIDDIISTGKTLARTATACHDAGAVHMYAVATHGLFVSPAIAALAAAPLDHIVVTDTISTWQGDMEPLRARMTVLTVAPLLAEAIRRLHRNDSLVELNEGMRTPT